MTKRKIINNAALSLGVAISIGVVVLFLLGVLLTRTWLAENEKGSSETESGTRLQQLALNEGTTLAPTEAVVEKENGLNSSKSEKEWATVKRVLDGDTIELKDGRKVRYIGMDTPELRKNECLAREARQANVELVQGRRVELEKDVSELDVYGRLLRYVYVDGVMVNEKLVKDGWAQLATYPPDVKYTEVFRKAQREAREEKTGLWDKCAD